MSKARLSDTTLMPWSLLYLRRSTSHLERAPVELNRKPSLAQAPRQGLGFPFTGGPAQAALLGTTSLQLVLLAFQ